MKIVIAIVVFCAAFALTMILRRSGAEEVVPSNVTHINVTAAAEMLASDTAYTVLDVRTAKEFAEGHIQGAVNIDIKEPGFAAKIAALETANPVIVHCRSGARSRRALPELQKLALTGLYHMDGGILAWQKAGLSLAQ